MHDYSIDSADIVLSVHLDVDGQRSKRITTISPLIMQRQVFFPIAIALANAVNVASQAASTTSNPLNDFIGAAGAAASQVKSAAALETPSSSSSPTPSPTPTASPTQTAAPANTGLSSGARIGIIVGCVVGAVLLLALLGLCCCLLFRRRRQKRKRATPTPVTEGEVEAWKSPINPGRHYSNYTPAQRGEIPMGQTAHSVPLMAAAATEHHRSNHSHAPSLSQHPAMRSGPENPFVPIPPSPRRTAANSRSDLTHGAIPSHDTYVTPEKERVRKSSDRSRSGSRSRPHSDGLPTHGDPNRPPTPFGLTGFGTPAGQTIHHNQPASPQYSGIGQPYEDMHVHILKTDAPSRELRHSLNKRETAGVPATAYDSDEHHKFGDSRGYSTPPEGPTRSPNPTTTFADSSYDSSLSTTTVSNSSGERYLHTTDPYAPAQRESVAPWEQHQHRFSNTTHNSEHIPAPPIPWEESEHQMNQQRRQSHSPRNSAQYDGRRRSSRSPATSINGQPRRLRFEDLQLNGGGNNGYSAVPGQRDSYDGYNHDNRWSHGVGEAM